MGTVAHLQRQSAVCRGDDNIGHSLQANGLEQCRHHLLHLMALPALGAQTHLEPVHRPCEDQAMVGAGDGNAHRRRLRRHCFHHSHGAMAAGHAVFLLGDGVCRGEPLRGGRRLLHARSEPPSAGGIHGYTHTLRPLGHDFRAGHPRDGGGQPASGVPQQHHLLVEPHVLWGHGIVLGPVAVA